LSCTVEVPTTTFSPSRRVTFGLQLHAAVARERQREAVELDGRGPVLARFERTRWTKLLARE
jgi:hypothetical protein